jgi:hypothetical protein
MRNLLALIGFVVVGFIVLGWYFGWYKLTISKGTDGKPEIKTTLDTDKVSDDASSFFRKVGQLIEEKTNQMGPDGKAGQPLGSPGNTPGPGTSRPEGTTPGGWFTTPARETNRR